MLLLIPMVLFNVYIVVSCEVNAPNKVVHIFIILTDTYVIVSPDVSKAMLTAVASLFHSDHNISVRFIDFQNETIT